MPYPTSIFALARSCLARPERSFSYLLFCKSIFSAVLHFREGLLLRLEYGHSAG